MVTHRTLSFRYTPGKFAFWTLVVIFVSYQLIGGGLTLLLFGTTITVDNATAIRWSTLIGQILFLLVPTLLLARRQHRRWTSAIPLRCSAWPEFLLTIIGVFSLLQFLNGYIYFQDQIPLPPAIKPMLDVWRTSVEEAYRTLTSAKNPLELSGVLIVVAVIPAICEEFLFRGLVQTNLRRLAGPVRGFLYTGIIFGVYHLNPFLVLPLVVLGIYFSFLRERSASVLVPVVAHCTNNCVSVITGYVAGPSSISETLPFVGESSFAVVTWMIGFGLVFATSFMVYLRVTSHIKPVEPEDPVPLDPALFDVLGTVASESDASLITANLTAAGIASHGLSSDPDESSDPQGGVSPVRILVPRERKPQAVKVLDDLELSDFFL